MVPPNSSLSSDAGSPFLISGYNTLVMYSPSKRLARRPLIMSRAIDSTRDFSSTPTGFFSCSRSRSISRYPAASSNSVIPDAKSPCVTVLNFVTLVSFGPVPLLPLRQFAAIFAALEGFFILSLLAAVMAELVANRSESHQWRLHQRKVTETSGLPDRLNCRVDLSGVPPNSTRDSVLGRTLSSHPGPTGTGEHPVLELILRRLFCSH